MEKRDYGKLEWFFYIIVLPLLFTGLISGIVLQFMGYDVTGKLMSIARKTPVISSIVPPDEATKKERSEVRKLQSQLNESMQAFEAAQKSLQTLKQDLAGKEAELNKLKQADEDAKKQKQEQQAADAYWKKQAAVYSEMSPKNAAGILTAMPLNEARAILGRMDLDVKASILEKMDPKVVSVLESGSADMQENGRQSADDYIKASAKIYNLMSPAKAAAILSEMTVEQARGIVRELSTETRAAILENMDPKIAAKLI